MAGVISTQSYVNPYQWSKQMGGKKGKKSKKKSKPKTKAQKMAVANKKKYGGTASAAKANKAANKASKKTTGIGPVASGKAYAKAVNTAKNQPKKKTSGIGPVASGSDYAKSLSTAKNQPTKKTSGVGPVADGAKYAAAIQATPKFKEATKVAAFYGGPEAENRRRINEDLKRMKEQDPTQGGPGGPFKMTPNVPLAATGDVTGLGISPTTSTNYFKIKSPDTFGAPSQEAVDAAAGITAGGLNIGGGGFTPDKPSGSNARAIADYKSTLDPNSFKGLSDGETFGSGPVISGDDYARGLNISPYGSAENTMRSVVGKIPLVNRIPGVNTRLLTDKEIADKRVKAAAFREANLVGRKKGGGGARLAVAATTPEEILLEEEAPTQTGPTYQQAGLDNNNLMQIQQNAYNQELARIYNPLEIGGFNPMFRFFGRRGGQGRGSFRRAFRRD